MNQAIRRMVPLGAVLCSAAMIARAELAKVDDPAGILRKPIPDKLVVLTFDDGPASGYTVVAPLLKSFGFGGSFYICEFDSFSTRKDWYMTWRQMKAMSDAGFEIGNHTAGHAGGCRIGPYLNLEDDLVANGVPKPTTVAWPVFAVNTETYPELVAAGYTFGRGGHFRPYRPTVDNPFDIPCLGAGTPDEFVKSVRQAAGGRIVVLIYHGVPDMEHAACSLDPAVFKVQMRYLKDNHYKVIALRDLAEYIDPAKAAKLPPTANEFKDPAPPVLASEEKPCGVPDIPKPKEDPTPGKQSPVSAAKDMLSFQLAGFVHISGTHITAYVPTGADMKALAPTFTLSPGAKADPASGTVRDFTTPQTYTITAQDGSTQVVTVTAHTSDKLNVFTWAKGESGSLSDAAKWTNHLGKAVAPTVAGQQDYVLDFSKPGNYTVTCDGSDGFLLNQIHCRDASVKLAGKGSLAFVTNSAMSAKPQITKVTNGECIIAAPLKLDTDLNIQVDNRDGRVVIEGAVSGTGSLVKNGDGELRVSKAGNTFSGGAVINRGVLAMFTANQTLGSGPITVNDNGILALERIDGTNPLILNGGEIGASNGFGDTWNGPITLNGNTRLSSNTTFVISGNMGGPGGFTHIGMHGAFGLVNSGTIVLTGINTYAGPTVLVRGELKILKAASLYNVDTSKWTPAHISIFNPATLVLAVGGPGEFTGAHIGTFLKNLAGAVNNNGLMAGAFLSLDTSHASGVVTIPNDISDSKGPGGGGFLLKKCGAGTMQFTGKNTYTGQTILEGGALSVASFNSVVKGRPSSSLGAPTNIETGEIVIGNGDGECVLIYTGAGETTDRVMNLAGKNATVSFDQAGKGLLKLTSTFVLSGHSFSKTIALKGDTVGTGEIAGNLVNPHDRAGKATTAVTKSGSGTWTLSGTNSYSGPTAVTAGTLALSTARSLGGTTAVSVSKGAILALNFKGEMSVGQLMLDGKPQPAGTYSAATNPDVIKGTGVLKTH